MKKNVSPFGRYFPIFLVVLLPFIFNKIPSSKKDLIMVTCIAMAVAFNTSKLFRFYKEANKTINAIWISSILQMISGGILYYFLDIKPGLGISAIGTVAFGYTLHYSFLENRPDVQ